MSTTHKPLVLIIDPDAVYLELMRDLLSQQMQVDICNTAEEALEKCKTVEYDLFITEIELPGSNGMQLLQKLKMRVPNSLFVVITRITDLDMAVEAFRLGAIDFIQKPFTVEDIASLIDKYHTLNVEKKADYDLFQTITEEKRTFSLPTDFFLINHFLNEVLRIIKRFPYVNKKLLLSIRLSVYEMLVNGMEHGNLEIDYDEKKKLLEKVVDYQAYLQQRAMEPQYRDRKIWLTYHYYDFKLAFTIVDEGQGFNAAKIPSPTDNLSGLNGRGIFITRVNMDEIEYNEKGNAVRLVKYLGPDLKTESNAQEGIAFDKFEPATRVSNTQKTAGKRNSTTRRTATSRKKVETSKTKK